jgi:hypothetical protein
MFDDDGLFPLPSSARLDEINKVSSFVAKKMSVLKNTILTSDDTEEKIETIANMILCQSSINLLCLAYLTEDYSFIEQSKNIYRGI